MAANKNSVECLKQLLSYGAEVNEKNDVSNKWRVSTSIIPPNNNNDTKNS